MTPLASIMTELFSLGTLIAQIAIVLGALLLLLVILKHPNERLHHISRKTADKALLIGLVVSVVSLIASLFYSNIIGFSPCELCWWQRVFLYPQIILFAAAFYNERARKVQDDMVFLYSLIFSIIGAAVGAFLYYGQMFNPNALALCATAGESCSKIFFISFGYISIPLMSLTVYAVLILLYFFRRHHAKNRL